MIYISCYLEPKIELFDVTLDMHIGSPIWVSDDPLRKQSHYFPRVLNCYLLRRLLEAKIFRRDHRK